MRICIHRGAQEIGGTCIEIESGDYRIVLDVGLPLDVDDAEKIELHPIMGFHARHPSLLGVIISHPHPDHYGLARRLPQETPFLIGRGAEAILSASALFSPGGLKLKRVTHLAHRQPIPLGPFRITPYLVDHSAYDSYAILVEADGESVFYTGDFRMHGRKARLMDELLNDPPKDVNVLLMEGTCVGREGADEKFLTEDELVPQFDQVFKTTPGMPLVWCSGQNIDRIVTVVKACNKAGRQLIIDMYTAEILRATGNDRIPQGSWDGTKVFLPQSQRRQIIANEAFDVSDSYRKYRIYAEELANAAKNSVMLFRPSMRIDLEKAKCLGGACLVNSMWRGYLELSRNASFVKWLTDQEVPVHHFHTSGHACIDALRELREAFSSAVCVPIHCDAPSDFRNMLRHVRLCADGKVWPITAI